MQKNIQLLSKNGHIDYKLQIIKFNSDIVPILEEMNIPFEKVQDIYIVKGTNMIDLLGLMYSNPMGMMYGHSNVPNIKVFKTHQDAVVPLKARESDVGYDLTIIKVHKKMRENVVMYDTGIQMNIPWGYYVEVVPRSSLSKTGWMLANSVGIIDSSYTGNIYVALACIDQSAQHLELPFKGFQIIIRKQYHANMCIQDINETNKVTSRGTGGFGSTG